MQVGIYGANGTTGVELVKLLLSHSGVEVAFCTSRQYAGATLADVDPSAPAMPLQHPDEVKDADVDVMFLCLPHGKSAPIAAASLQHAKLVIDLSGDLRLQSEALHQKIYGTERDEYVARQAVYGLTEFARPSICEAKLIANPGCYPTCAGLGLLPLVRANLLQGIPVINAVSGVSGAGRKATETTHFCSVTEDVRPYKVGRVHRHTAEIEQTLQLMGLGGKAEQQVVFSPHLVPLERGMLATMVVESNASADEVRKLYQEAYENEPFVQVLPEGSEARIRGAARTNRTVISIHPAEGTNRIVIISAIDNLLKGAAGQAVQNMNIALGITETEGLTGAKLSLSHAGRR